MGSLKRIAALTALATASVMATGFVDVAALGLTTPTVTTTVPTTTTQVTVPSTTTTVPSTSVTPTTTVTTPTVKSPTVTTPTVTTQVSPTSSGSGGSSGGSSGSGGSTGAISTPTVKTPALKTPTLTSGSGSGTSGGGGGGGGGSTIKQQASSTLGTVGGLASGTSGSTTGAAGGASTLTGTGAGSGSGSGSALQALGFFGGPGGPSGTAGGGGGTNIFGGPGAKGGGPGHGGGLPATLSAAGAKQLRSALDLLQGCMSAIPPIDRQVLGMRAGAGGNAPLSRGQVASRLGISTRQVRLSERRGLNGLRTAAANSGCAGSVGGPFAVSGVGLLPLVTLATTYGVAPAPALADDGGGTYVPARQAEPGIESPLASLAGSGESGPAWLVVLVTVVFSVSIAGLMRELRSSVGA